MKPGSFYQIQEILRLSLQIIWASKYFRAPIDPGQLIQYIVTPVAGIKTKWVTEITQVRDHEFFIDEQRFGPYALWHHKHFIKEIPGGVEMEDIVDYKLPLGFLGRLAHPILVEPKLKEIFDYRREKLIELYGEYSEPDTQKQTQKHDILN